jgi:proline iminopeptidase
MFNRRAVLGSVAAFAAISAAHAQAKDNLVAVRGTRLYVERFGDKKAMPIVYVHGGPGSGSYDAGLYQGARLSAGAQLICLDQRGVLRSDPETAVTVNDIIEDLEAVRQALGIRRWVLWGHSFGGYYATKYALRYGDAVAGLVYENITLDPEGSTKHMLRGCAALLDQKGLAAERDAALALAEADVPKRERFLGYVRYSQKLGADRQRLYVHQEAMLDFFPKLVAASGLGARWRQEGAHYDALIKDDALLEDLRPLMPQITAPALMIRGRYDLATPPEQVEAYLKGPRRALEVFEQSSHFVHAEEPDGFARSVLRFMKTLPA